MSSNNRNQSTDSLTASALVSLVQFEVLLKLVLKIAKRTGLTHLDGLPLLAWFQQEKSKHLQQTLIDMEDASPELAAYLQKLIDESERRIKEQGGEV